MSQSSSFECTPQVSLLDHINEIENLYQQKIGEIQALSAIKETIAQVLGTTVVEALVLAEEAKKSRANSSLSYS